jgi:hypothetical protein
MEPMSLTGVPEAAVYGNASEVPDRESGEEGVHADVQWPNETIGGRGREVPEGMAVLVGPRRRRRSGHRRGGGCHEE